MRSGKIGEKEKEKQCIVKEIRSIARSFGMRQAPLFRSVEATD